VSGRCGRSMADYEGPVACPRGLQGDDLMALGVLNFGCGVCFSPTRHHPPVYYGLIWAIRHAPRLRSIAPSAASVEVVSIIWSPGDGTQRRASVGPHRCSSVRSIDNNGGGSDCAATASSCRAEISFDDVETLIALGWLAREASSDRHAADLG
jgi:hypothetical protein